MPREILYNTVEAAVTALSNCATREEFLAVVNQISTEVVSGCGK
jgi:hypothetical protein